MDPRFHAAFEQFAPLLQSALAPLLDNVSFPAMLTAVETRSIKTQTALDDNALAIALLPLAAACAHASLSQFNVGAIARGVSGNLYFGSNMEFPGTTMQQTVHAEQSAISHAWMRGETGLAAITVNHTPCGHCRQFMNELNSGINLRIHLPGRPAATLGDYLPEAFGPGDLSISRRLMDMQDRDLQGEGDALCQVAIAAANRSHAPYSDAPSGVAIAVKEGRIFSGSYAENAAFNPTMPPLQSALNLLSLNGIAFSTIERVVLAEKRDSTLTQWETTVAMLHTLGCQNIERVLIA